MAATEGMPGVLKHVVRTFLEEDHYKTMYKVLSEQWSSCHSLTAAMKLMEAHGVKISKEEEARLMEFEESRTIDALVAKMPQQNREQFEHFFLQLSFIASTTKRLRDALQEGDTQTVHDALESAENIGVLPHMLKMIVAQAGAEVKKLEEERDQWLVDQSAKMGPLLQAQAGRMEIQKQLANLRQQMGDYRSSAKDKGKSMLLKMADANQKNLIENCFGEWAKHTKMEKMESFIVAEYQYDQKLATAKKKLIDFRSAHLSNARKMMEKNFQAAQASSIANVFQAFKENVEDEKRRKEGAQSLEEHEKRLAQFNANARANAQKALGNMNAGNEKFMVEQTFNTWVEFMVEYKKDKEMNDLIKKKEQEMAEMMKKQNQGAMDMMKKMGASSDNGLLASCIKEWKAVLDHSKEANAIEEQLNQKSAQLSGLTMRGKGNAANNGKRSSMLQDLQLTTFVFCFWKREAQVERVKRYGRDKNEKRKKELLGVKGLFKDFAGKLDSTLKAGTPRMEEKGVTDDKQRGSPPKSPQMA